jgi:biopolymer transport protein ExbD
MSKFKKKASTSQNIPTSSLPDIIFMLLFFFMVTTVLRETDVMVKQSLPRATQLQKLEQANLVSYIYVGAPLDPRFGSEPKIQLNDVFAEPKDLILFVAREKDRLPENQRDAITMSLKVDKDAKMGIVTDVQMQLRNANARKILYANILRSEVY